MEKADIELLEAVESGDHSLVCELLDKGGGANVEVEREDGWKSLHILASYYGHCTVLERLLDRGADMEAMDEHNKTPLIFACWNGQLEAALLLIDRGASNMEAEDDDYGMTPLHFACKFGHFETAVGLLDRGANILAETYMEETPFHLAIDSNFLRWTDETKKNKLEIMLRISMVDPFRMQSWKVSMEEKHRLIFSENHAGRRL